MSLATYARFELLRTFRNRRFVLFSFGFPLVLYVAIAAPNRDVHDLGGTGISAPLYFMTSLAVFGAMSSVLSIGGRIATERSAGWNRQLRLTALSTATYFRIKLLTAYATALCTIAVLYLAGIALGVHLGIGRWAAMTALLLVGLIPFAALGIAFGLSLSTDSIGPALGGSVSLLALLGGVWFPITGGLMHAIAEALPSYWLVQASRVGIGGHGWGVVGWSVVAVWTIVLAGAAALVYRRDSERPAA